MSGTVKVRVATRTEVTTGAKILKVTTGAEILKVITGTEILIKVITGAEIHKIAEAETSKVTRSEKV